jgi:small-conductance mechanosensitive channel
MQTLSAFIARLQALLPTDPPYLIVVEKVVLVLAVFLLSWFVLVQIVHLVERKIRKYEFIRVNAVVFKLIRRALFLMLLLAAGSYLIQQVRLPLLENIFHAFIILWLAKPVKDFLIISVAYLQKKVARQTASKIDDIIFELLSRFAGIIIYVTAIVLALDTLGFNVMPFIAGAGVAGIAIGFAAKDTLSNLIAGILLIIDRPFEVGDRIEVWSAPAGSSTWGDVIDIGLRATKIKTTDNIVIIIPNNEIMLRDIINYTTISEKIRVRINIGIAYDANVQQAKDIILQVAATAKWVSADPPPKVVVRNFGESSVDLQLRVWIADARRRMDTISYITDRIKAAFDEQGIEIPYPKRDIYIRREITLPPAESKTGDTV